MWTLLYITRIFTHKHALYRHPYPDILAKDMELSLPSLVSMTTYRHIPLNSMEQIFNTIFVEVWTL